MAIRMLAISKIHTDMGTQVRECLRRDTIAEYVEAIERGDTLPPIIVFECMSTAGAPKLYVLADGFHRVKAYEKTQAQKVNADVRKGTLDDAKWFAIGANKSHGLTRSNKDKENAVKAALKHPNAVGKTDVSIAEHCGVSQPYVGKLRKELEASSLKTVISRTGKDGRTINTTNIGSKPRNPPAEPAEPDDDLEDYDDSDPDTSGDDHQVSSADLEELERGPDVAGVVYDKPEPEPELKPEEPEADDEREDFAERLRTWCRMQLNNFDMGPGQMATVIRRVAKEVGEW